MLNVLYINICIKVFNCKLYYNVISICFSFHGLADKTLPWTSIEHEHEYIYSFWVKEVQVDLRDFVGFFTEGCYFIYVELFGEIPIARLLLGWERPKYICRTAPVWFKRPYVSRWFQAAQLVPHRNHRKQRCCE